MRFHCTLWLFQCVCVCVWQTVCLQRCEKYPRVWMNLVFDAKARWCRNAMPCHPSESSKSETESSKSENLLQVDVFFSFLPASELSEGQRAAAVIIYVWVCLAQTVEIQISSTFILGNVKLLVRARAKFQLIVWCCQTVVCQTVDHAKNIQVIVIQYVQCTTVNVTERQYIHNDDGPDIHEKAVSLSPSAGCGSTHPPQTSMWPCWNRRAKVILCNL